MKNNLAILLILVLVLSACNNKKDTSPKFKLTGTIEGVAAGKVLLAEVDDVDKARHLEVDIVNGKFEITRDFHVPKEVWLSFRIKGNPTPISMRSFFWAENANMVFKGHIDSLDKSRIEGGKIQNDINVIENAKQAIYDKYKLDELATELRDPNTTDARKKEISEIRMKVYLEGLQVEKKFFKENPASPYAAVLMIQRSNGQSAEEIEESLKNLHPDLEKTSIVKNFREKVARMKKAEIGIENIIEAEHVNYKVDKSFKGEKLTDIKYLAAFSNDNICALNRNGNILVFDEAGEQIACYKDICDGEPKVIAVDESDNIYVITRMVNVKEQTHRGKARKITTFSFVCVILNSKGDQINKYQLEGLRNVVGGRVINNTLLVSDDLYRKIILFSAETGAKKNEITDDIRPCCNMLDFWVNDKNEILVANLGAFRVQSFDFTGKFLFSFGQRGRGIDDFHGCCNPVSLAYLSNGAIVTAEKSPTRIKVYSKEGAKQIAGIEELVKGCTYIPMTVDNDDNLYLASDKNGIIRCVPVR